MVTVKNWSHKYHSSPHNEKRMCESWNNSLIFIKHLILACLSLAKEIKVFPRLMNLEDMLNTKNLNLFIPTFFKKNQFVQQNLNIS